MFRSSAPVVVRAGLGSSAKIRSYVALNAGKSSIDARNAETFTTSPRLPPAATAIASRLRRVRSVCSSTVVPRTSSVSGSRGPCPETYTKSPARIAWEYAPVPRGAASVRTSASASMPLPLGIPLCGTLFYARLSSSRGRRAVNQLDPRDPLCGTRDLPPQRVGHLPHRGRGQALFRRRDRDRRDRRARTEEDRRGDAPNPLLALLEVPRESVRPDPRHLASERGGIPDRSRCAPSERRVLPRPLEDRRVRRVRPREQGLADPRAVRRVPASDLGAERDRVRRLELV